MKKATLIFALMLSSATTFAQDAEAPTSTPLEISGSGDLYYKYDFAKVPNIGTSFASDQNSLSLGMLDIALKKSAGKASFVGEISFGPRGQSQSIPNSADGNSFHIQNLYATYAFTDKFSMTAGYMGTFVGYEVISPVANFHYSTSYLFTNGPFQNAGVKANYKITDKFGAMVGVFNDRWNVYSADSSKGLNAVGAQLSYVGGPVSAYLNFLDGSVSGTVIDLTATFQLSEKFKLGLNAADFSNEGDVGYKGFALYPSVAITDAFALGLRAEYFEAKKGSVEGTDTYGINGDESVTAFTFSANYKVGGFTVIPEFRLDSNSEERFFESNGDATKSAAQATLAVVYGF
jgi:hypothetical protein